MIALQVIPSDDGNLYTPISPPEKNAGCRGLWWVIQNPQSSISSLYCFLSRYFRKSTFLKHLFKQRIFVKRERK